MTQGCQAFLRQYRPHEKEQKMQTLLNVVRAFLTENGYRPERKGHSLWARIRGDHGLWQLNVMFNEDDRWLICYSQVPFAIPEPMRKRAVLLLAHLNVNLILGNFELDFADGEVCFKTSMRVTDDALTEAMARDLLYCNFSTFDRYLPSFMALVFGRRSVKQAVALTAETPEEPAEEAPQQLQLPPAGGSEAPEYGSSP
jgi:hypothetical protein